MNIPEEIVIDLLTALSTQTLRGHRLDPERKTDNTLHNEFKCAALVREVCQLAKEQGIPLATLQAEAKARRFARSEPPRLMDVSEFGQTYIGHE